MANEIKRLSFTRKRLMEIYEILFNEFGPQNWWPGDSQLEIVVGAILTQNTAWRNVEKAILNVKQKDILSSLKMDSVPEDVLAQLIRPSGYYNQKAMKIKEFLAYFKSMYDFSFRRMADRPLEGLRDELLGVHGIGEETADSILLYALEKPVFVIDAYTKRIFSRLGFIEEKIPYKRLQELIMRNLPENNVPLYNEFHALIVAFAHNFCRKRPLCGSCLLRNQCSYWSIYASAAASGSELASSRIAVR